MVPESEAAVVISQTMVFLAGLWKDSGVLRQKSDLSARGLMSCCGNLESKAESSVENRGLVYEVSEGSKDASRAVHALFRLTLCRSETFDLLLPLMLVSWAEESAGINDKSIIAMKSSGTTDTNLDLF